MLDERPAFRRGLAPSAVPGQQPWERAPAGPCLTTRTRRIPVLWIPMSAMAAPLGSDAEKDELRVDGNSFRP